MKIRQKKRFQKLLGQGQEIAKFAALREELLTARDCPPQITIVQSDGKRRKRGDILPFVRGLRLSARLIYILREKLRDYDVEVNWGHVQDDKQRLCSPECDIIIHKGGMSDRWNGHHNNNSSVMDFWFIQRDCVKAIISCKSMFASVDDDFAKVVKKNFQIKNLFLFVEAVKEKNFKQLRQKALASGYKGVWPLYRKAANGDTIKEPQDYLDFLHEIRKVL